MSYLSEWPMEIQAPEFHNDEERWIKNNNSDQLKKKRSGFVFHWPLMCQTRQERGAYHNTAYSHP